MNRVGAFCCTHGLRCAAWCPKLPGNRFAFHRSRDGLVGRRRFVHAGRLELLKWTYDDIPDQSGRVAVVTGANTGIGFETARALARRGARVVLACRSRERGAAALGRITAQSPAGSVELAPVDLADLESIRRFSDQFSQENERLHLLINNAGVMWSPPAWTTQGFELHLGVNHLGHFALTLRLLPVLHSTRMARVVTVASQAHRRGKLDLGDPHFAKRRHRARAAYAQSKLANLLFTFELQRRFESTGVDTIAVAAHPGWTTTDLQRHHAWVRVASRLLAMSTDRGALPTLRAATAPDVHGGDYYGPDGFYEMWGHPVRVSTSAAARSADDAAQLWARSEELTGLRFAGPRDTAT